MEVYLEGAQVALLGLGQLAGSGLALSCFGVGDVRGIGQFVYHPLAHILCHFAHASRLGKICLCSCSESSPADLHHVAQAMQLAVGVPFEHCVGCDGGNVNC